MEFMFTQRDTRDVILEENEMSKYGDNRGHWEEVVWYIVEFFKTEAEIGKSSYTEQLETLLELVGDAIRDYEYFRESAN